MIYISRGSYLEVDCYYAEGEAKGNRTDIHEEDRRLPVS